MVRRFFGVWGILNGSALAFQRSETTVFSIFENNFQIFSILLPAAQTVLLTKSFSSVSILFFFLFNVFLSRLSEQFESKFQQWILEVLTEVDDVIREPDPVIK